MVHPSFHNYDIFNFNFCPIKPRKRVLTSATAPPRVQILEVFESAAGEPSSASGLRYTRASGGNRAWQGSSLLSIWKTGLVYFHQSSVETSLWWKPNTIVYIHNSVLSGRFCKLKDDNYHVVEEAIIHSKTLSVQPTGLAHVGQEKVKGPCGFPVGAVQPSELAGETADLLEESQRWPLPTAA